MKITPVLYLETIEDSLSFWTEKLGFTLGPTVPHGDALGFAILTCGDAEVMLQTWRSAEDDAPAVVQGKPRTAAGASLFIEVDDLAAYRGKFGASEVVLPERSTFYGMRELGVAAPSGHVIVLAEREGR